MMFYALVMIDTGCHTLTMVHFAIKPEINICLYCVSSVTFIQVVYVLGAAVHLTFCWLVIANMYQFALSLQVIFHKISTKVALQRRNTLYWVAGIMATAWLFLILLEPLYLRGSPMDMDQIVELYYDIAYSTLLLLSTAILIYLLSTLRMISTFFKKEQRHIIWQFFVFEGALVVTIAFQVLFIVDHANGWSDFSIVLLSVIDYIIGVFPPAAFMLLSHYYTFE